jgi:hypothetical protein
MTIQETFAEWFRQLDPKEQNILLEYVKDRFFQPHSPQSAIEKPDSPTADHHAEPGPVQGVCPTCKRKY